ncbi:ATP-binding protein [Kineosporia sp. R_H_3]|uniref:ATP-binding protein n=1 Tax=Kineosporia sp. R_H_3 TaxID=1961848 RepID=UPI000B4AE098|nr:ATP-binding protein [Kineosporia sp. R_H_3]
MTTVKVQAGQSILEGYVKRPSVGLSELVWNSFDEDAHVVTITCGYNGLGGLEEIEVADDGNGMGLERAERSFSRVGDSWKLMPGTKSVGGTRVVHGRHGRGRYAAFGLGNVVRWVSTAEKVEGGLGTVRVTGRRTSLDSFDIETFEPEPDTAETGTRVSVIQLTQEAVAAFDAVSDLRQSILIEFALHLDRHKDFSIRFLGHDIDPGSVQEHREVIALKDADEWEGVATLTIIEWKLQSVRRAIFLCDADDRVFEEVEARIQAPGSEFTAYLKWDGFGGREPIGLEDDTDTPTGRLIAAARDAIRQHLSERHRLREAATIQRWRDEGVWPYKEEPKTQVEAATRDTFRVVAMAASRTVDESKSGQSKALALRLLRETFENDPEALLPILTDLARLPKARIDELAQMLRHTTLSQLIQTGRAIGSRMDFLSGLNTILFDRQIKSRLLERRQLHRILAHETWIFGEEWSLTGDDERLTKVLRKFLSKLGKEVELADLQEVRLEDGSDAIPDLVLGRRLQTNADSFEQLVVELKRPKHKLDDDDVSQLRAYASAIVNDDSFAQPNVKWDFWLVGNETTRTVDEQRRQRNLPFGVVQETDTYRLVVKQWSELISDAQHRLKFVQNSLDYETSHDSGLAYLRERYPQYLPAEVSNGRGSESDVMVERPQSA